MEHDPGRRRPRLPSPPHLPGRRPAGPRLRPAHRPSRGLVYFARQGAHRGPDPAPLPGTRLVGGPHGQSRQEPCHRTQGRLIHLSDQAPPDRRRPHDRPGPGGPQRLPGLLLGTGRGDVEGRTPGRWRGLGDGRGGLGMVALEEGPLPRPRPATDKGEGLPHRLWRGASGHRHPAQRR